jgi:hypothetical protein
MSDYGRALGPVAGYGSGDFASELGDEVRCSSFLMHANDYGIDPNVQSASRTYS